MVFLSSFQTKKNKIEGQIISECTHQFHFPVQTLLRLIISFEHQDDRTNFLDLFNIFCIVTTNCSGISDRDPRLRFASK